MKRNKYINSFDTTTDFDNYIESAAAGFPNVALTKDNGNIHYTRTSQNDHLIYGEVVDVNGSAPVFKFNNSTQVTAHIDSLNGTFYVDATDMTNVGRLDSLENMSREQSNIKTIKKFAINTSSVTSIIRMFYSCSLESLNLYTWDLSSLLNNSTQAFTYCDSLTDVYINVEATLNILTNNLTGASHRYIPYIATIHYDNGSEIINYKWQNNAWRAQS